MTDTKQAKPLVGSPSGPVVDQPTLMGDLTPEPATGRGIETEEES